MKRLVVVILFFILMQGLGTGWCNNRALLIGVNSYQDEAIPDLAGVSFDVELMQDIAQKLGFNKRDIRILTGSEASLKNIEQEIESWLIKGTTKEDRAILYYSGHGTQFEDMQGDEKDGVDEALIPYDAVKGVDTTLLSDDRFNELLSKVPAGELFVFIDACHSGTATKEMSFIDDGLEVKFVPWTDTNFVAKGAFVGKTKEEPVVYLAMAACRDDEEAIASRRGSLFTLGVKKAVEEAEGGRLTPVEAVEAARGFIAKELQQRPDKLHHPKLSGDTTLAKSNLFILSSKNSPQPVRESRSSWTLMEDLVAMADYKLQVRQNQKSYRIGEQIHLSVEVPKDGYLNIINIGEGEERATLLFPNRFVVDNFVHAGERVTLPGSAGHFKMMARPPVGDTLVVAYHSEVPFNLYKEYGHQSKGVLASMNGQQIERFSEKTIRLVAKKKKVGAATLITEIRER